jgi:hypothetical protein
MLSLKARDHKAAFSKRMNTGGIVQVMDCARQRMLGSSTKRTEAEVVVAIGRNKSMMRGKFATHRTV